MLLPGFCFSTRHVDIDDNDKKVLPFVMETIIFKVPTGTKKKLKRINPNISALLREATSELIENKGEQSAYEKSEGLAGIFKGGPSDMATSRDYLKQYAPKNSR